MEKYCDFNKHTAIQEAIRKFSHRSCGRMPIIRLPKKKARPNGNAMSQGLINGYSPRLHDGSRKSRGDTDISLKKSAPTMKRICPKIKLTDRECGQNGSQCAVPMRLERNQGKTARQSKPKIRWRQGK